MKPLALIVLFVLGLKPCFGQERNVLSQRFKLPEGYTRVETSPASFEHYLQYFALKAKGSQVHYYDGRIKDRPDVYCAVLDLAIGSRDLVQCADACMLLYGEYLFQQQRYDELSFNFVSDGKGRRFVDYTDSRSYKSFRKYMNFIFAYANTRSLYHQLKQRDSIMNMQIGDVFIQTGNPYGHAVIVMDMAVNKQNGEKIFMLAQSYMPAQDIQILNNPVSPALSPWYMLKEGKVVTPEWKFKADDLRHF